MTTLTDRYVWGVLRAVPEAQRPDLEPEIRAMIADAVDARVASVAGEAPTATERAVLTELGDPGFSRPGTRTARCSSSGPRTSSSGSGCC